MPTFDVHQHLWPEPFVAELSRRARPPRLHGSTLQLAGEGEFEVDLAAHDLDARLLELDRDGIEQTVVSLQPTLGIDALPEDEAEQLRDAYHDGIRELERAAGGRIRSLASGVVLAGFVGTTVPAGALGDLDALAPHLSALERDGGLLFVHPGPAAPPAGSPSWWAAVVDYTAQMQAAYAAWVAQGADRWPDLRVIFAILAGGATMQLERLVSRGVDTRTVLYPNVYFETASYGRHALELCLAIHGVTQILYGSDRPVIDGGTTLDALREFGDAVADAVLRDNPTRLLA